MSIPDYATRAERHRPDDLEGLRQAALELVRNGLTCRDVAAVLKLSSAAVVRLIENAEVAG